MRPGKHEAPPVGGQGRCLCRSVAVEVGFEPTEGLPPHTLSRNGRGRPSLVATGLTRADGHAVVADERPRTGVNETETETTHEALGGRAERPSRATRSSWLTRRPRTISLPLFRRKDHRLGAATQVVRSAQRPAVVRDTPHVLR
jgi:hypothetical protein